MSAERERFDPNRPDSTPPTRGRTEEQLKDEERAPPSSESDTEDENGDEALSRNAEIDRQAKEEFDERRKRGRPESS